MSILDVICIAGLSNSSSAVTRSYHITYGNRQFYNGLSKVSRALSLASVATAHASYAAFLGTRFIFRYGVRIPTHRRA